MARIPPHAHRQRRVRRTFSNNISKRRVDWGRAILEGGGGDEGAQWPRWHSQRDTRPPESTAAFSRCAFRAFSVPSDRNRSPRAGVRGASILAGAARERRWRRPGGWRGSIRALETSQSDRRAPIREAHGHIIYIPGSLRGRGRAWMGGQWVDMRGVLSGFCAPRAKM